jgi:hypothetical protein
MISKDDICAILLALHLHERGVHRDTMKLIETLAGNLARDSQYKELTWLLLIQIAVGELIAARVPPPALFDVIKANSELKVEVSAKDPAKMN